MEKSEISPLILIVDEDVAFQNKVAAVLLAKGFRAIGKATWSDAEQILSETAVDMVALAGSPKGKETRDSISSMLRNDRDCLIVLMATVGPEKTDCTETARELSVQLVIEKPALPEEIAYKIQALLKLENKEPVSVAQKELYIEETGDLDHQLVEELRTNYVQKVPRLFAKIGESLVCAQSKVDPTELLEARRLTHALTGTAGSLGLDEVFSVANAMEEILQKIVREKRITSMPPIVGAAVLMDDAQAQIAAEEIFDGDGRGSRTVVASVLVVDDDPEFLAGVVEIGRENLIQVYTAQSGQEAIEIATSKRVDAAIIDIYLSKTENPFDVAEGLRSIEGLDGLPLGFISADSSIPTRIAAVHAGASLFLSKPLQPVEFVSAVRRLAPLESEGRPRIFIVDDDEDFLQHILLLLEREGFMVETLSDPSNILDVISDVRPDLVLLDVVMPHVNGFDVCRVLRSTEQWRDLPILFLTIHPSEEVLLKCFEAGGDDYIEKPVLREELLTRLNVRLERVRLFRERADRDGLTGLPTRRAFIEQLKVRLAEGMRYQMPISLCLIDVDHFKNVNDMYGHLAGDRVLSGFGRLINRRFRTMDVRGRWGGEEFVVAFYGEEADTAKMIIERMRDELRDMVFTGDHGERFKISFSAGIASFPESGESFEDLFRVVDKKLYAAKSGGRDRTEI